MSSYKLFSAIIKLFYDVCYRNTWSISSRCTSPKRLNKQPSEKWLNQKLWQHIMHLFKYLFCTERYVFHVKENLQITAYSTANKTLYILNLHCIWHLGGGWGSGGSTQVTVGRKLKLYTSSNCTLGKKNAPKSFMINVTDFKTSRLLCKVQSRLYMRRADCLRTAVWKIKNYRKW